MVIAGECFESHFDFNKAQNCSSKKEAQTSNLSVLNIFYSSVSNRHDVRKRFLLFEFLFVIML